MSEVIGVSNGRWDFVPNHVPKEYAAGFGEWKMERSVCDGQRGYTVTLPNGVRHFHFRLDGALRQIMRGLGHAEDRDLMVIGEPESGNAW